MIPANIVGISQDLDFKTKEQLNFAVFELKSGHRFRALIDDSTAQAIVAVGMGGEVPSMSSTNGFVPGVAPDGSDAQIFGGNHKDEQNLNDALTVESMESAFSGVRQPTQSVLQPRESGEAKSIVQVRPRLVGKDDAGNPILEYPGGVDPTAVIGTIGDGDEDGVRQL